MNDCVSEYIKRRQYGEHLNLSRSLPKLEKGGDAVKHYIKLACYGFPGTNSSDTKAEEIETDSNPVLPQGNDVSFTTHNAPVRNIDWR